MKAADYLHFMVPGRIYLAVLCFLQLVIWPGCRESDTKESRTPWVPIFNGVDLSGWTPKFSGHKAGGNYKKTFIVEDSMLRVSYAAYDSFRNEFGHIFFEKSFSFYRLKLDYRFTGPPTPGAPAWAIRNNGVMIFSQDAASMRLDQDFPVSVETELLGGLDAGPRPTANICTPGTNVYVADTLNTDHCIRSNSKTYNGDEWIALEIAVLPNGNIHHIVNGDTVMTYSNPEIGGSALPLEYEIVEGTPLQQGYIALQAESHPTDFRNLMIQEIPAE